MSIFKIGDSIPDRIYNDAKDVHVSNYVAYVNADGLACYDAVGLRPMNSAVLKNLYYKGFLLCVGDKFYSPAGMVESDDEVVISFFKYDSATEKILYSTCSSDDGVPDPDPEPEVTPSLTALSIGDKVLTPTFDPAVFAYSTSTADASNTVTMTVSPEGTAVAVKLGGVAVADYVNGGEVTWVSGENTLAITVGETTPAVVYTVTVTKTI